MSYKPEAILDQRAREFWQQCFLKQCEYISARVIAGMDMRTVRKPENSADIALVEWRKRFDPDA